MNELLYPEYNLYSVTVPTKEADDALDRLIRCFENGVQDAKDGAEVCETELLKRGTEFARSLLHHIWDVEATRQANAGPTTDPYDAARDAADLQEIFDRR